MAAYYAYPEKELFQAGIQEGELAIYTGSPNPNRMGNISTACVSRNPYIYLWENGQAKEQYASFSKDREGVFVMELKTEKETYLFLRDMESGYLRQVSGPAKPIVVANLGAFSLRVDTMAGKFLVHGGSIVRLNKKAPRRKKKYALVTFDGKSVSAAASWNEDGVWKQLNICKGGDGKDEVKIMDGRTVVLHIRTSNWESDYLTAQPEPVPDYDIYIINGGKRPYTVQFWGVSYQNGRPVEGVRSLRMEWAKVYDLQKARQAPSQAAAEQCTVSLADVILRTMKGRPICPPDMNAVPALGDKEPPQNGDGTLLPPEDARLPEDFPE